MKFKHIIAAILMGAAAAGAHASLLTFDNLTDFMHGNGFPLAPGMHLDGASLVYEDAGVKVTLHAPGAAPGEAHIGDGTFELQTFNWHDGLENGAGTYVTLTRADGGRFDLLRFDFLADVATVLADGTAVGTITDAGTWTTRLDNISELRLLSGSYNQIDNVDIRFASAVPEPSPLVLMLGGALAAGLARCRGRHADATASGRRPVHHAA